MEYRDGARHAPTPARAPKPLRILKTRQANAAEPQSSVNDFLPIPIPRRQSSHTICGDPFSGSPPLPESDKENRRLPQLHQKKNYWHSFSSTPSISASYTQERKPSRNKRQGKELAMESQPNPILSPKNGFLSRVTQVFDFKNRRPSGNAVGLDTPTVKTRSPLHTKTNHHKKSVIDLGKDYSPGDPNTALVTAMEWKQNRQHTPTPAPRQLWIPRNRAKIVNRSPRNAPITTATVELTADALKTEAGNGFSTWLSVEVFARVENLESHLDGQCSAHVPLDVMIVVDNSARMSPEFLKGACRNAFYVASSLDILTDRVAVGCMSTSPGENMNLLLPLETHRIETLSNVFRSLPAFQLLRDDPTRLSGTLMEASASLLQHSGRSALCHLFFITTCSAVSMPDGLDERLRFHTISPENSVMITAPTLIRGWHLSASLDNDVVETSLKSNLQLVVKHLRTGIDSGVLSNLSLDLTPAEGYEVIALLGDTKRKSLRPGESWTMLVKIQEQRFGAGSNSSDSFFSASSDSLVIKESMDTEELDNMIDQLHGMLQPIDNQTGANTVATATVVYANSCFNSSTSLRTEEKCELGWISARNPSIERTLGANYRPKVAGRQAQGRRYGTNGTVRVRSRPQSWRLGVDQVFFNSEDQAVPDHELDPAHLEAGFG